ncbi:CREB-regulated transcription coactivator-like protein, partial [Euroglyphus maynei]
LSPSPIPIQSQNHLHITPAFNLANRAGSLPNVNHIEQQQQQQPTESINNNQCSNGTNITTTAGIDLQSALNNLQEIKNDDNNNNIASTCSRRNTINNSGTTMIGNNRQTITGISGNIGGIGIGIGPGHRHHSSHNISSMGCGIITNNNGNRSPTQSGYNDVQQQTMRFMHAHRRSQSPYSINNNAYLSPPEADTQWRRTNSDSALHQS